MDYVMKAIHQILKTAVLDNIRSPELGFLYDIKNVYYGDPVAIASDSLPAITIHPMQTDYLQRGSQYDQKTHTFEVRLVFNEKEYYNMTASNYVQANIIEVVRDSETKMVTMKTDQRHYLTSPGTVTLEGFDPITYNGVYTIQSIIGSLEFQIYSEEDPGIVNQLGYIKRKEDTMFSVENAILKTERQLVDDHSTELFTVCGVIQGNPYLHYTDENGRVRKTAELSKVISVNYSFNDSRGYPTFEVVVTMQAVVIGDRRLMSESH